MKMRIGWLFPDLMNTYGDRGNVLALSHRARQRGIDVEIEPILTTSRCQLFSELDLVVGGGAQNRNLEIVHSLLEGKMGKALVEILDRDTPALMICGAMQLLGKSIEMPSGALKQGLGFFGCRTHFPPDKKRIMGDLIFRITATGLSQSGSAFPPVLGFENHAGCTYLDEGEPLGEVISGSGNNGEDQTEGVFHKQTIGSYAHGPLLPKNPFLTDWLLQRALERKYREPVAFDPLEDLNTEKARSHLLKSKKCSGYA